MNKPLDELYLTWLYEQIADSKATRPSQSYWNLANFLFTTEFIHIIPNDDNRAADGRDLRNEFVDDLGLDEDDMDPDWFDVGCSMLELLIGLSRRLSFQGGGEPRGWFWELIDNLGLRHNDRHRFPVAHAEEVLNDFIWRTYRHNGSGGLFPLRRPRYDQRDADLWNQLNAYLLERTR